MALFRVLGDAMQGFVVFSPHMKGVCMTQTQLNREVARATGESVETIQRLGFLLDEPNLDVSDPTSEDLGPYVLDWDALEQARAGTEMGHAPA